MTIRCVFGTLRAGEVLEPYLDTQTGSGLCLSVPMERHWLAVEMTTWCASGMSRAENVSGHYNFTRILSGPWLIVPMASCWPAAARTRRYGCGIVAMVTV